MNKRLFAIGDIHGCYKAFRELVDQKIQIKKSDKIILLGDYIDRGTQSKEVVDYIIELQNNGFDIVPLMGNHEAMLLNAFDKDEHLSLWIQNGGSATLKSFGINSLKDLEPRYLEFFKKLPYYFEFEEYLFVHAGFNDEVNNPFEDKYLQLYLQFANRELMILNMKKHNGMRPQDVVVLLKIVSIHNQKWRNIDIANALQISPSEVSEALNRCRIAGLIDSKKRNVHTNSFKEFLIYGLKYVFPVEPGAIVKGIPTAHSASPINEQIASGGDVYVWPYAKGTLRGQAIEPLYKTLPAIIQEDKLFYELLAIVDTIRVGRAREIKIAIEELEKRLQYAQYKYRHATNCGKCLNLLKDIAIANASVKAYLKIEFKSLSQNKGLTEGIESALPYGSGIESTEIICELIRNIAEVE